MEYWSVGVLSKIPLSAGEYWVVKAEKNYFVTPPRPPRLSEQARDGGQVNPLLQYSIAPWPRPACRMAGRPGLQSLSFMAHTS